MSSSSTSSRTAISQSTYSNAQQIRVNHHSINLNINFEEKILHGYVEYDAEIVVDQDQLVQEFVLDARNLDIEQVEVNGETVEFEIKDMSTSKNSDSFGHPLHIPLASIRGEKKFKATVYYKTTPKSEALVWMDASQTKGKQKPFMYSQCQAIHARSLMPCQDTPEVKATFDALITCDDKDLVVIMGAIPKKSEHKSDFVFEQKVPIPSYLLFVAAGNLAAQKIGPRSTLYTEPEQIMDFAYEFEDTEKFIKAGEEFLPPYEWDQYNILVASPSYNFGGMENPNMTLCSASLLAGDKSNASVIVHEYSHSFSGNSVTCRDWRHFFLNEGGCVYVERRILARIYGQEYADFHALLALKSLNESVDHFLNVEGNPEFTKMVPDLEGIDPDDAFSSIPYEKGFNFLYYLTGVVGGFEPFEKFMYAYFSHFAKKCVDADEFKAFFLNFFQDSVAEEKLNTIEWDKWFYGVGGLPVQNKFDRTLADPVENLAKEWKNGTITGVESSKDVKEWKAIQFCYLLDLLQQKSDFTADELEKMDKTYKFTESRNSEIRFRWQILCIKSHYEKIYPEAEKFLSETGRMKFVRPITRALLRAKNGRQVAEKIKEHNKNFYMATTMKQLEKDFANLQ